MYDWVKYICTFLESGKKDWAYELYTKWKEVNKGVIFINSKLFSSEKWDSVLQWHCHLIPLHLPSHAVRHVLPRLPSQVRNKIENFGIYPSYFRPVSISNVEDITLNSTVGLVWNWKLFNDSCLLWRDHQSILLYQKI